MTIKYKLDTLEVSLVATLMGCKESNGLVNRMNDLDRSGKLEGASTVGEILNVVLFDLLNEHNPVTGISHKA